jgi:transcriptional regulator with XRE-family HTH domain
MENLTIRGYRDAAELRVEDLATRLGCSKGHASDLCNGNEPVSKRIAEKMQELTGIPWHKWIENDPGARAKPGTRK